MFVYAGGSSGILLRSLYTVSWINCSGLLNFLVQVQMGVVRGPGGTG